MTDAKMLENLFVYVRRKTAYLPTTARTAAGFWIEVDPVTTADITQADEFERALVHHLSGSHPSVPTPGRHNMPVSALARAADVKSEAAFARQTRTFLINLRDELTIQPGVRERGGWTFREAVPFPAPDHPTHERLARSIAAAVHEQLEPMNGR